MKKLFYISFFSLLLLCGCKKVDIPQAPNSGLAKVSNLQYKASGRALTLTWDLPAAEGITGVQIIKNQEGLLELEGAKSSYYLRKADTNQDLVYTVKVRYGNMVSEGVSVAFNIPYESNAKAAYLLMASSVEGLPNQEEQNAANWFKTKYVDTGKGDFITPSKLPEINSDSYSVIWIHIDREGLESGWRNLPEAVSSQEYVDALKAFVVDGGNLFLTKQATQLLVAIGRIEEKYAPNIYGTGSQEGTDVWSMNANLGNGTYNRTKNKFFKKLAASDPNNYGYKTFPLVGKGMRTDNNCMWNCNGYGFPGSPDVINDFQVATGCVALATWGQVTDLSSLGVAEFAAKGDYAGNIFADGMSAFQFYQGESNEYKSNLELFASNVIDNYMK